MFLVRHPVICLFDGILKYEYLLLFTFSWEKESLIGQRFFFSVRTKENKYSYFKIRNFVKLANHRMTSYMRHKSHLELSLV